MPERYVPGPLPPEKIKKFLQSGKNIDMANERALDAITPFPPAITPAEKRLGELRARISEPVHFAVTLV